MASINGFTVPATDDRRAIGVKSYAVPGTRVVLPVRSEVAPLLIGAAAEFNAHVEPLVPGHCWGYAYRPVRGGTTPSFHAAGIAVDLNAPEHPMGTAPSANFSAAEIAVCRAIARKYGLRWGGDYSGRKDGMHFEVILDRTAALALVKRLQTPPTQTYVVRAGDTLGRIAVRYHLSLAALLRLNPGIKNPNLIAVGQRVRVR